MPLLSFDKFRIHLPKLEEGESQKTVQTTFSRAGVFVYPSRKYRKDFFMVTSKKKLVIVVLLILVGVILLPGFIAQFYFGPIPENNYKETLEQAIVQKGQTRKDYYTYKGENGKSASEILTVKERAWLEYGNLGKLMAINLRKADPKKREYWAFYLNGKLSQVGASDYITKDTDVIEWKIEHD